MFTVTVLEILLWKAISVFWPAQWSTGCKRVKVTVENQKCIGNLFELLEKWLTYKIKRFWMVFKFFRFCLSLSVAQKLKNSIFQILITTRTLNINNLRTTSANSINLIPLESLLYVLWKILKQTQSLLLLFLRYCCPKVGRFFDVSSGPEGAKGLQFE